MNALALPNELFRPAAAIIKPLDQLFERHENMLANINLLASYMRGESMIAALQYYASGYQVENQGGRYLPNAEDLLKPDLARKALDAAYWSDALRLTDCLEFMPAARRQEWHENIHKHKTPPFERANVMVTLETMLGSRLEYFAEMVDGIFRGLSGDHVTNSPKGFAQRMIVNYVFAPGSYAHSRHSELFHDFRIVCAKFLGRPQPEHYVSDKILNYVRERPGEWQSVDGNAFRVRCYKKGTAHLEVHEDLAWRLNAILAHRNPRAIPAEHRTKIKAVSKIELIQRPLSSAVIKMLADLRIKNVNGGYTAEIYTSSEDGLDKHHRAELAKVMELIGGVTKELTKTSAAFAFDYDVKAIVREIMVAGVVPDHKSYQFYPTPESVATKAVELAEIEPQHRCLEPNGGLGGLAKFLPRDKTTVVEISKLFCTALNAADFPEVICGDFLEYQAPQGFDRVVMNPPFDRGQALAHVEHAAKQLNAAGVLVAILPASFAGKSILQGRVNSWSAPIQNEFLGTSVSVVILKSCPV